MSKNIDNNEIITYEGCNFFRQRLILSTLSGKSVKIKNIRPKDEDPGLRDFEASFLRLLDTISNGCKIEVNQSGTRLLYQPGLLIGGRFQHDCSLSRSIGYYLEALLALGPFCKKPLDATLRGVTNDQTDPSVDMFKHGTLPTLMKFSFVEEDYELNIVKRGVPPQGGGEVVLKVPICRLLRPVQITDPGKIKRIRGVAFATRVSPITANRIVEIAKGILLKFIPDVFITTDHLRGPRAGKSPGFGICLVAQTTTGVCLTAELVSNPAGSGKGPSVPEDLGREAAHLLLEEIYRGGCVSSCDQSLVCLFMALGQPDISKVLTGPLSPYTIQFLRHLRDFFQVVFKLDSQPNDDELQMGAEKVLMTCLGVGFSNLSKITN